jgi:hypothetical protein
MAQKIRRYRAPGSARVLRDAAALAGLERQAHFEGGGSLVAWKGGPRNVTKNRKRVSSQRACRGKVAW